jgi:hypothetical protein
MAIEMFQTKRAIVYRVVVHGGDSDSKKIVKTFRTRAAAEEWERDMLQTEERGEKKP